MSTIVDCGDPISPINGHVGYYPHTREGVTITFQCNIGYVPSITRTATCDEHGRWVPAPEEHSCTIVTGRGICILYISFFVCSHHYCISQHL